ncbi:MAG: alkaline phosphatase family protein [Candidatus Micrarchaeales archaeon]
MSGKKLYLIGIDSTPLWIIDKLKRKYNLSGFDYISENGTLQEMESTVPPVTSAAWPSIYIGLEPRKHQVLEFSKLDSNYNKHLMYYDSSCPKPFWEILAAKGLRCLVITPAVFLENKKLKNIDLITGWPLQPRYSSAELESLAKKQRFNGEPDIGVQLNSGEMSLKEASRIYVKSIRARAKLAEHLIASKDYDMVFVCFTETDRIQHYALSEKNWDEIIAPLYVEISKFINWTVSFARKKSKKSMLLVVSDHGAQPTHHKFLPNSWLVKKGYAKLKQEIIDSTKNQNDSRNSQITKRLKKKISEKIASSSVRRRIYEHLPASLQKIGEKFVEENLELGNSNDYLKILDTDFDMRSTKAFASVSNGNVGMIWINDPRFAKPIVSADKKRALKAELINGLKNIKDLNGKKLIANIYKADLLYRNVTRFIPPDIVFRLNEGYTNDFSHYSKSIFVRPELARRGDHTMYGILGITESRKKRVLRNNITVCNIAPTITKYFGIKMAGGKPLI